MYAKTAILSVMTAFFANQAMGAALGSPDAVARAETSILIATDAFYACNCPNNCDYKEGTGCRYYSGPSDTDTVTSGTCAYPNGNHLAAIECVA